MFFSNLVMYFIILATAATLHRSGTSRSRRRARPPRRCRRSPGTPPPALALGLIGTGLLAIPVLAGSASFAVAEVFRWRAGLDLTPRRGRRFYEIFTGAVVGGMALTLFEANPIRVLFLSAVLNGLLAPPLMVLVMLVGNNRKIMGPHANGPWLNFFGWTATAVMTAAAVAFLLVSLS